MGKARHDGIPGLDRRLTPPTDERWSLRLTRGRMAPALFVAAVGSILVAAPVSAQVVDSSSTSTTRPDTSTTDTTAAPADSTTSTVDPFDTTTTVTTVEGDSTTTVPTTDFKKAGRVKDVRGDGVNHALATGSRSLIDGNGLKYFVNTDITFSTTSSASAAMSEASYTTAVPASTTAGGTVESTLNDAFDGYNSLCVDVSGVGGTCQTGNASFTIFNKNGAASADPACPAEGVDFPTQNVDNGTVANLDVTRQVYVPAGGDFARWLNTFTNNDSAPVTFRATTATNLGSDSNTIITGSSSGGSVSTSNTWVGTMQNFSGNTSSDPRAGHILQGSGGTVGLSQISFVAGDDNPFWSYDLTLQPGETASIANFYTASGLKATANTAAASLATGTHSGQWGCMTTGQKAQVLNFDLAAPPTTTTTTPPTTEAPTTEAPAAEAEQATGTLPYTGAGGELIPLAGAGAAAMGAGSAAVVATKRRLRRPRFRHGR